MESMVLMEMRCIAERFFGKEVKNAVIVVPAYLNYSQRRAFKNVGGFSGLNVLRIIDEASATAIAKSLHHNTADEKNINVGYLFVDFKARNLRRESIRHLGGDHGRSILTICSKSSRQEYIEE